MRAVFVFLTILLLCSCEQKQKNTVEKKPRLSSLNIQQLQPTQVLQEYESYVSNWMPYTQLRSFMKVFDNTSTNEALTNALELKGLLKTLKEGTPPVVFNSPSFKARINVLHSEGLRLADMTYISAITSEEVRAQVTKIMEAYSALNAKINALLLQLTLEERITTKDTALFPIH